MAIPHHADFGCCFAAGHLFATTPAEQSEHGKTSAFLEGQGILFAGYMPEKRLVCRVLQILVVYVAASILLGHFLSA